eukprot:7350229-Prymnesium_polylepis.1
MERAACGGGVRRRARSSGESVHRRAREVAWCAFARLIAGRFDFCVLASMHLNLPSSRLRVF